MFFSIENGNGLGRWKIVPMRRRKLTTLQQGARIS